MIVGLVKSHLCSTVTSILKYSREYWSRTRARSFCTSQPLERKKQLNVLFYGSDRFSIETLKLLSDNNSLHDDDCDKIIKKLDVVSGENSLVGKFSRQKSIVTFAWPYSVPQDVYDIGIVVSFGNLIPKESIDGCKHGIINVHGSLLPRWRGPSPIHHAILAGDAVTGVTIMKIVADEFDVGSILARKEYRIPRRGTTSSVYADLSLIGAELLFDTLVNLEERVERSKPQPSEGVTKAPKARKHHGKLNFTKMSSVEVDRRVRAFTGLIDVYAEWPLKSDCSIYLDGMVDPIDMEIINLDECIHSFLKITHRLKPGSIYYHKPKRILCFKCCDHKWVGFESIKITGKRKMTAIEFFNGFISHHSKKGLIQVDCNGKLIQVDSSGKLIQVDSSGKLKENKEVTM